MIEYITEETKELIAHLLILSFGIVLRRYAFPYNSKNISKIDDFLLPKEYLKTLVGMMQNGTKQNWTC